MSAAQVDYDSIAGIYDRRFSKSEPDNTLESLASLCLETDARRVLEVGCGTAHWLNGLQAWPHNAADSLELHGMDLSSGMLAIAQGKGQDVQLARGRAGYLPYRSDTFDLVYCVNAIHHFSAPRRFIFEARRTLTPGGKLAVIGSDPHRRFNDWYIYTYFPGTYERDLERFPSWDEIRGWMAAAGFSQMRLELVRVIHDPQKDAAVLNDPYLQKNATSQLALLSQQDYEEGLASIRAALAEAQAQDRELVFPCDIHLQMLSAE